MPAPSRRAMMPEPNSAGAPEAKSHGMPTASVAPPVPFCEFLKKNLTGKGLMEYTGSVNAFIKETCSKRLSERPWASTANQSETINVNLELHAQTQAAELSVAAPVLRPRRNDGRFAARLLEESGCLRFSFSNPERSNCSRRGSLRDGLPGQHPHQPSRLPDARGQEVSGREQRLFHQAGFLPPGPERCRRPPHLPW